ncbi:hypothetical protein KTE71_30270 [Burkholderia multivorans]|uniref:hypothetical protein n=1 Tax=Burkholderia multivorans TaxID=87883 RepID=UPI001BA0D5E4|nr:hypothetical protein [Burkholderia multivorans]MBR8021242.1 hypothetical protein [Burkholderia multivorans]MBU9391781.1 hypothetical protein [Burkholderia multivorans]
MPACSLSSADSTNHQEIVMSNVLRSMMGRAGLSFGHLAKVSTRSARAEENDGDDQDDRDDRDDSGKGKKGRRAESDDGDDDGQNRDDGDSKRGSRAEGDDGDDQDDRDDSGKGKKGRRAESDDGDDRDDDDDERAENDDDDEEEMRGKSAVAKARRRERARCAAIFGCKAAGKNPVLAANLAFNTSMTRRQAIRVLNETPAPQASYGARRNPNLGTGAEHSPTREQAVAASWDRAFARARGAR